MTKFGRAFEGFIARDEEQAVKCIIANNSRGYRLKREAKEAADKAKIKASITLPKLKSMGER